VACSRDRECHPVGTLADGVDYASLPLLRLACGTANDVKSERQGPRAQDPAVHEINSNGWTRMLALLPTAMCYCRPEQRV
jgi:hypothetical protein